MLDGEILGEDGKAMASIDNIVLENGYATHIIAGFDKILGLGGHQSALAYGTGTIAVQERETDVVLNSFQTANFQTFQEALSN